MWNLRNKLLIPILGMVILGLGAASLISYSMSSNALQHSILNDAEGSVEDLRDLIGVVMKGAQSDSEMLAGTAMVAALLDPRQDSDAYKATLKNTVQALMQKKPYYMLVHVIDKDGMVVATSASAAPKSSLSGRAYFQEAMRGQTDYIGAGMKSAATGKSALPVSQPIMVNGKPAGVLLVNIDLGAFSDTYVKNIALGESGYAFITSSQGEVLAYPKAESILSPELAASDPVQRLKQETASKGNFLAEFNGKEALYVYEREPVTGWLCAVRADTDDIYGSVASLGITSAVISVIVAALIALVVFLVVRTVVGSLKEGVAFATAVAQGNLDNTLSVQRGDEIGALADALRTMVAKLKEMIATSEQKTAEAVEQTEKAKLATEEADAARRQAEQAKSQGMRHAGQELAVIAGKIDQTARELVAQVRQAAEGSEAQKSRTTETATAMEEMNATVIEVARNAGAASGTAETAKQNAEDGAKIVAEVIKAITEVDQKTGELKTSLNSLGEQAQGIGQIMGVITDIADQTNLLALNAAIEAARAGEYGRGFAVVADEVRKLAEKTMTATKEVGDAVRAIQAGTTSNIAGMEDASNAVGRSTEMVRQAGDSLKAIVDISDATADKVRSIATASEEQSAASEEITHGTEQIAGIAEETSRQMAEAQNAVRRLSELVGEINSLVNALQQA